MTAVVAYLRVSGQKNFDNGISIAEQRRKIEAYCVAMSLSEPQFIIEEGGTSGFKDSRPGFKRLSQMVEECTVSTVIIYKLCRLARNVRLTLEFLEHVNNKGIDFISLNDNLDTSSAIGKFNLTLIAAINQLYRDQLSEKMVETRAEMKLQGRYGGGQSRYGYKRIEGEEVPDLAEQGVLRFITTMAREGMSFRSIAADLTARGVKTKRGKGRWHPKVVRDIIMTL